MNPSPTAVNLLQFANVGGHIEKIIGKPVRFLDSVFSFILTTQNS